MCPKKGLETFIREKQLTDKEWLDLIETRREIIKPHLDSLLLTELGSLACMQSSGNFNHGLQQDVSMSGGDKRFSLKTKGIFGKQPWEAVNRIPNSGYRPGPGYINIPDGTMQVWGLTHSGLWVLVTIDFVGESGYKDRGYERATAVKVVETSLPLLVFETEEEPEVIWEEIGKTIKRCVEDRKNLYHQALGLAQAVEAEEFALSLLLKKA